MKKTWLLIALILITALLQVSQVSTTQAQDSATNNGNVSIYSPSNKTYASSESIRIYAIFSFSHGPSNAYSANYTIDDGPPNKINKESIRTEFWSVNHEAHGALYAEKHLPTLQEGQHKLFIYMNIEYPTGTGSYSVSGQKTVYFTVSTTKTQDNVTHEGARIDSPCNRTYAPNEVIIIKASASSFAGLGVTYEGKYSIDGKGPYPLHAESHQVHSWDLFYGAIIATGKLSPLSEGQHRLTVYLKAYTDYPKGPRMSGEATVYFTVGEDQDPPNITLDTLDGAVFNQTTVPLNFSINEPTSWIGYILDNGTKTTITANTNLTVTPGNHNITVYAKDTAGNMGQSKVAYFNVQTPTPLQTLNPAWLAAAAALTALCVATGLIFYLRRKSHLEKRNASTSPMNFSSPASICPVSASKSAKSGFLTIA